MGCHCPKEQHNNSMQCNLCRDRVACSIELHISYRHNLNATETAQVCEKIMSL